MGKQLYEEKKQKNEEKRERERERESASQQARQTDSVIRSDSVPDILVIVEEERFLSTPV